MNEEKTLVPLSRWETTAEVLRNGAKARAKEKTPKTFVKKREGRGKNLFDYVKWSYARGWLDDKFPGWSFKETGEAQVVMNLEQQWGSTSVRGELSVIDNGLPRVLGDRGGNEIEFYSSGKNIGQPVSIADALKGAVTNCKIRCARNLGFAWDIYDSSEDREASQEQIDKLLELLKHPVITDIERFKLNKMVDNKEFTEDSIEKLIHHTEQYLLEMEEKTDE